MVSDGLQRAIAKLRLESRELTLHYWRERTICKVVRAGCTRFGEREQGEVCITGSVNWPCSTAIANRDNVRVRIAKGDKIFYLAFLDAISIDKSGRSRDCRKTR